jgi:hypothetical protein
VGEEVLIREGWVENVDVRLHYIEGSAETLSPLVPIVYVHGAYGTAEGFLPEIKALRREDVSHLVYEAVARATLP